MPKYIELEKALESLQHKYENMYGCNPSFYAGYQFALDNLKRIKSADAAPVVHGRWTTPRAIIECSKCGFGMFPDGYFFEFGECVHANESQYRPNFCPNCGVKLDLEDD